MQLDWFSSFWEEFSIFFLIDGYAIPFIGKGSKYILLLAAIVGILTIWISKKERRKVSNSEEQRNNQEHFNVHDDQDMEQIPYPYKHERQSNENMLKNSWEFYNQMSHRRSVRLIASDPIPREVIDNIVLTAGTSPSGAHTQPWTFVVVSNANIKAKIREIIEREEYLNYQHRMGKKWVDALKPLACNWVKTYLTEAPYLILLFRHAYGFTEDGQRKECYYNEISSSISIGLLLCAIQNVGLTTVVTTPLNCGSALRKLLERPCNEKLVALLPIGHPAPDALIPNLHRKTLEDIMVVY